MAARKKVGVKTYVRQGPSGPVTVKAYKRRGAKGHIRKLPSGAQITVSSARAAPRKAPVPFGSADVFKPAPKKSKLKDTVGVYVEVEVLADSDPAIIAMGAADAIKAGAQFWRRTEFFGIMQKKNIGKITDQKIRERLQEEIPNFIDLKVIGIFTLTAKGERARAARFGKRDTAKKRKAGNGRKGKKR